MSWELNWRGLCLGPHRPARSGCHRQTPKFVCQATLWPKLYRNSHAGRLVQVVSATALSSKLPNSRLGAGLSNHHRAFPVPDQIREHQLRLNPNFPAKFHELSR